MFPCPGSRIQHPRRAHRQPHQYVTKKVSCRVVSCHVVSCRVVSCHADNMLRAICRVLSCDQHVTKKVSCRVNNMSQRGDLPISRAMSCHVGRWHIVNTNTRSVWNGSAKLVLQRVFQRPTTPAVAPILGNGNGISWRSQNHDEANSAKKKTKAWPPCEMTLTMTTTTISLLALWA